MATGYLKGLDQVLVSQLFLEILLHRFSPLEQSRMVEIQSKAKTFFHTRLISEKRLAENEIYEDVKLKS